MDNPVTPSSPTKRATICFPSEPMTVRSGGSKKLLFVLGRSASTVEPVGGGTALGLGTAGLVMANGTRGGGKGIIEPNSTSASGNQATIVCPSSIARPAITLV